MEINYDFNFDRTFIIAEIGVNHNGDVDLAKKMIKSASECGVDAVKFQTFNSNDLVSKNAKKAKYQEESNDDENQLEMLKKLELSEDDFKELKDFALDEGVLFLSSPFDKKSVDLLESIDVPVYKLGSGEFNNFDLIEYVEMCNKPLILSCGMSTFDEIKETYDFIKNKDKLILLHCITGYPTSFSEANLNFIKTLQDNFNVVIGFSDHSPGIELPIAAVALGSKVIEKHFTIDKSLPGPDHKASLNPDEFKAMVSSIRNVELAIGDGVRRLSENELAIKEVARKSIIVKTNIKKGEVLTEDNLTIKRPGNGIEPKFINKVLGRRVNKDLEADSILSFDDLT
ncbi:MAG: N-acetylneuraminate synthase [Methanobrevibacter sp.]|nr:N-acetylneuraminate synthase [Methanobrevibacter sp.]